MENKFLSGKDRNKPFGDEHGFVYQKATEEITNTEIKRDGDGFYLPRKINPARTAGLMCAVYGDTPSNRWKDIALKMHGLAKEVYECEIQEIMLGTKCRELMVLKKFACEDIKKENAQKPNTAGEVFDKHSQEALQRERRHIAENEEKRLEIIDSLVWRYDWIQQNKKDCYLFARYTIEYLYDIDDPVKYLKSLPKGTRLQVLNLGMYYDAEQEKCVFINPKERARFSKEVVRQAETYWGLLNCRYEQEKFRADFTKRACRLPEANRRLLDMMYELAWDIVLMYELGWDTDKLPEPWYQRLTNDKDDETDCEEMTEDEI